MTALLVACSNGHKRVAKACLRAGADLHGTDNQGRGVLYFCATYGHVELAEYLVSKGAEEVESKDTQPAQPVVVKQRPTSAMPSRSDIYAHANPPSLPPWLTILAISRAERGAAVVGRVGRGRDEADGDGDGNGDLEAR